MKKVYVSKPKENTRTRAGKDGFYLLRLSLRTYQVKNLYVDGVYFEGGLFKSILFLRSLGY
tara:strand:- start:359 stop:541 length:183 start_codon:yes stop_codon:yes gene_type:complete